MKATLATLACLLTVGFLSAAEVTGNNTAVVIRKAVVESDTGFQFLCVPVNGLDIANGSNGTIKLSTLLPASTLTAGTVIRFVGGELGENNSTATVTVVEGVNAWSADFDLEGGQIYWLSYQAPVVSQSVRSRGAVTTYAQTTSSDTVIFCGQDREYTPGTPEKGQVVAMRNDSSKAVTLAKVFGDTAPTKLDTILTIQSNSSEYRQYVFNGTDWIGPANANSNDVEIAPGEAFYYLKRR